MPKNKSKRDALPKHFNSIEEMAAFWGNHDLTDYSDLLEEVQLDVENKRSVYLVALDWELAKKLTLIARKQGISTETLINVWLTEKMTEAA